MSTGIPTHLNINTANSRPLSGKESLSVPKHADEPGSGANGTLDFDANKVRGNVPHAIGKDLPNQSASVGEKFGNSETLSEEKGVLTAVKDLNDYVQNIGRQLKFNVDDDTGRLVVTVLDSETEEVIRQIPSEEIMEIARNLQDEDKGLVSLLNVQA